MDTLQQCRVTYEGGHRGGHVKGPGCLGKL